MLLQKFTNGGINTVLQKVPNKVPGSYGPSLVLGTNVQCLLVFFFQKLRLHCKSEILNQDLKKLFNPLPS